MRWAGSIFVSTLALARGRRLDGLERCAHIRLQLELWVETDRMRQLSVRRWKAHQSELALVLAKELSGEGQTGQVDGRDERERGAVQNQMPMPLLPQMLQFLLQTKELIVTEMTAEGDDLYLALVVALERKRTGWDAMRSHLRPVSNGGATTLGQPVTLSTQHVLVIPSSGSNSAILSGASFARVHPKPVQATKTGTAVEGNWKLRP